MTKEQEQILELTNQLLEANVDIMTLTTKLMKLTRLCEHIIEHPDIGKNLKTYFGENLLVILRDEELQ